MAKNSTISEPTDQGVGPPPGRPADIMLVEIAKIQSDGEYIKRDLGEVRSDNKDIRDRLARLEERVSHLPGKGFIVAVVTTSLVITGGLLTIAPKIQAVFAAAPIPITSAAASAPAPAPVRPAK